jgi:hypothetical protein
MGVPPPDGWLSEEYYRDTVLTVRPGAELEAAKMAQRLS